MKTIFKFKGEVLLEKDGYCPVVHHSDVIIDDVKYSAICTTFRADDDILVVNLNKTEIHFYHE